MTFNFFNHIVLLKVFCIWTIIFKVEHEFGIPSQTYKVLSEVRLSEIETFFKLWLKSSSKLTFLSLIHIFNIYMHTPPHHLMGELYLPGMLLCCFLKIKNSVTKRPDLADS